MSEPRENHIPYFRTKDGLEEEDMQEIDAFVAELRANFKRQAIKRRRDKDSSKKLDETIGSFKYFIGEWLLRPKATVVDHDKPQFSVESRKALKKVYWAIQDLRLAGVHGPQSDELIAKLSASALHFLDALSLDERIPRNKIWKRTSDENADEDTDGMDKGETVKGIFDLAVKRHHVRNSNETAASEKRLARESNAGRVEEHQEKSQNGQREDLDLTELNLHQVQADRVARDKQGFGSERLEDASNADEDDEDDEDKNDRKGTGRRAEDDDEARSVSGDDADEEDDQEVSSEEDQADYFDDDGETGLLEDPDAAYAPFEGR